MPNIKDLGPDAFDLYMNRGIEAYRNMPSGGIDMQLQQLQVSQGIDTSPEALDSVFRSPASATTEITEPDSPTPAGRPRQWKNPLQARGGIEPAYAVNSSRILIDPAYGVEPVLNTSTTDNLVASAASQPVRYQICRPPYNPLGLYGHHDPAARDSYTLCKLVDRQEIYERVKAFRAHKTPKPWFEYRVHAQSPSKFTFCEYYAAMPDIAQNLHGAKIVRVQDVFCPFDYVRGLLIEWETVKQAKYFLYHYNMDSLLTVASHSNMALLPPRFVDGSWPYTTDICADLDGSDIEYANQAEMGLADRQFAFFESLFFRVDHGLWESERCKLKSPWTDGRPFFPVRNVPSPPPRRVPEPTQPTKNSILVDNIERGRDCRTTVMVRNIPSSASYWQVKATLDNVCPGRYGFLYLRADFKTGNNVGYFFVDFCGCGELLAYMDYVEGRSFPGFPRSDKRTQLSYADYQGVEALTDHFRNSAIMQKEYEYRPHLFFTVLDNPIEWAGLEKEFPMPNNLTRLDRSVARASQEGLYVGSRAGGRAARPPTVPAISNNHPPTRAETAAHIGSIVAKHTANEEHSQRLLAHLRKGGFH